MFELLHRLADWTEGLADSDWAVALLSLVAISESVIFPIPPDPLLIAIGLTEPGSAIWLAGLVTVGSVIGAYMGHWLGRKIGRPLLRKLVSDAKIERVEALFNKYGAWAILVAAFTPIPFKVFTILAGIMNLEMRPFILASIIGRGARFLTIGVLIFIFGEDIQSFIDANFEILTVASGAGLIAVVVGYFVFKRMRASGQEID
ncbi:MAG: YqaA family protein [SAR202 cluster bacterium]|jgi:undecaprenyl-diphosphatase|nr:YqaA family protein [SAR202 cluster bacterium]MDP6713848.1 YqaA family protein [SAR202 cluster bacterium]